MSVDSVKVTPPFNVGKEVSIVSNRYQGTFLSLGSDRSESYGQVRDTCIQYYNTCLHMHTYIHAYNAYYNTCISMLTILHAYICIL